MNSANADTPVVIFAGGRGARFDHETQVTPKPLIQVAGQPMIKHIIDGFAAQGFKEFIIATGYLGNKIRDYFESISDKIILCPLPHDPSPYRWVYSLAIGTLHVIVVDTDMESHTGRRLWMLRDLIKQRHFVLTYGDGLSNVMMEDVFDEHTRGLPPFMEGMEHPASLRPMVTLTAVNPPGRFGVLNFNGTHYNHVRSFVEKGSDTWINGGFMFCDHRVFGLLNGQREFETDVLPELADRWLLRAHKHRGYWRCIDTRRDLEQVENDVNQLGYLPWMK